MVEVGQSNEGCCLLTKNEQIFDEIEKKFPLELAMDFDNSGFLVGDRKFFVKKIFLCLDVTSENVEEAIKKWCKFNYFASPGTV